LLEPDRTRRVAVRQRTLRELAVGRRAVPVLDVRRRVESLAGLELVQRSAALLYARAAFLDEQNLRAGVLVSRRARAGLEPAARDAPAFGLERATRADEALGVGRRILRVRKPEDRDSGQSGCAE
jgi:putative intracellular protease/amidase